MGNGAVVDGFRAAIANVRSFVKAVTAFPDIISAGLITGIPMNTKVVCIIKGAFVVPVTQPVKLNFLGDGSRIFA